MALPATLPDPGRPGPGLFDCPSCTQGNGPQTRAAMHCGYLPRSSWPPGKLRVICGPEPYTADVCPGWVVRQPMISDAARAWRAHDKNALQLFDPLGLNVVFEMVEILDTAIKQHEAVLLRRHERPRT